MSKKREYVIKKYKGADIKLVIFEYERVTFVEKTKIDLELIPSDDPRVFYNTLFVDVSEKNDSQCHTWKSFEIKYNSATDLLEINGCYVDNYYLLENVRQENIVPTYMLCQTADKIGVVY